MADLGDRCFEGEVSEDVWLEICEFQCQLQRPCGILRVFCVYVQQCSVEGEGR